MVGFEQKCYVPGIVWSAEDHGVHCWAFNNIFRRKIAEEGEGRESRITLHHHYLLLLGRLYRLPATTTALAICCSGFRLSPSPNCLTTTAPKTNCCAEGRGASVFRSSASEYEDGGGGGVFGSGDRPFRCPPASESANRCY